MAATVSPIANIQLLNHHNYEDWSFRVKVYLLAEDVWDVVEATTEPPKREDGEAEFRAWRKNNAKALLTIQMCCGDDTYYLIKGITTAKAAWDALAEEQKPSDDDEGINPSDDDEGINPPDVDEGRRNNNGESDVKYESLYDSLKCGDWNAAKEFISQHPESLTHRGSSKGGTALHEAIESKRLNIVENLLQLMSGEDLEIEDRRGCTAFYYALTKGVAKIVASMVEKNSNLVTMRFTNKEGKTPVVFAHTLERYEIARFLYSHTPSQVLTEDKNGQDGADLLCQCIFYRNFFDSGWDLLQHNPKLGLTQGYFMGISPLYELAASRWAFPSGVSLRFWQRWIYKSINVQPQPAPTNSVDVRLNFEIKLEDDDKRNQWDLISSVTGFFQGIVKNLQKLLGIHGLYEMKLRHERCFEFLKCMSSEGNPRILGMRDGRGRTMFQYAVECRQEKVFNLIYGLSEDYQNLILKGSDNFHNTILHVAGSLSAHLNHIKGAALQMQSELQWFKEVKSLLPPQFLESINAENMTAQALFTRNHKELMKEGEESMKETATSCTVVGALIVTIMFAAAFTVPGGSNQDTATSVMIFLGILTSRYSEDDFL